MFQSKLKASFIHLGLSVFLVASVISIIILLWFPSPFLKISDFQSVAKIIISVDLVLGPLLTFVVFKPGKKTLKFDLSVIAGIQLAALLYGAYALYQVHPVYVTFTVDRFTLVSARDVDPEKAVFDEYNVSRLSAANLAYAQIPEDREERNAFMFSVIKGGVDLEQRFDYYKPYLQHVEAILDRSLDVNALLNDSSVSDKLEGFREEHENDMSQYAFLPINSASQDGIIVIDKDKAQPVDIIMVDPWKYTKSNKT